MLIQLLHKYHWKWNYSVESHDILYSDSTAHSWHFNLFQHHLLSHEINVFPVHECLLHMYKLMHDFKEDTWVNQRHDELYSGRHSLSLQFWSVICSDELLWKTVGICMIHLNVKQRHHTSIAILPQGVCKGDILLPSLFQYEGGSGVWHRHVYSNIKWN